MRIKKQYVILYFTLLGWGNTISFSQGPPPPASCATPPCPTVPIDTNISILILAAAMYGGYKLYKREKLSL